MKGVIVVLSQNVEAVVELLKFLGKPSNLLTEAVELSGMVLVLSNRRDVYNVTTANSCSCPSAFCRPGQRCKHQRKYFPQSKKSQADIEKGSDEELARLHKAKWASGRNGPVDTDFLEEMNAGQQGQEA